MNGHVLAFGRYVAVLVSVGIVAFENDLFAEFVVDMRLCFSTSSVHFIANFHHISQIY